MPAVSSELQQDAEAQKEASANAAVNIAACERKRAKQKKNKRAEYRAKS